MKVSEELEAIIKKQGEQGVLYLRDFIAQFGDRSLAFIIALLTLPIALPFTPPGVNTPFGAVSIILSLYIMINRTSVRLPAFIENRRVPFKPEGWFFKAMTNMLQKIENIIKPRFHFVVKSPFSRPLLGFGMLCASIVMLLPIPVVNSISSLFVLLVAIGMITEDGFIAGSFAVLSVLLLGISIVLLWGSIVFLYMFAASQIGTLF